MLLEHVHDLGHCRELLADGHVNADESFALLVDDRVDGEGALAGLTIANDQLALTSADRDQGIDGLDAGLDRSVHSLASDDAGGDALHGASGGRGDRALVIQRPAERIHNAAEQGYADGNLNDSTGRLDRVAFLDLR